MLAISNCDHPKTSLTIQDHCMFQIKVNALLKSGERSVRNYFRLGNAFAKLSAWWSFDLHQHTQRTFKSLEATTTPIKRFLLESNEQPLPLTSHSFKKGSRVDPYILLVNLE